MTSHRQLRVVIAPVADDESVTVTHAFVVCGADGTVSGPYTRAVAEHVAATDSNLVIERSLVVEL